MDLSGRDRDQPRGPRRLACVTGRFQPFHNDHLELVLHAARLADHVIVAITNPDVRSQQQHPASRHRHLEHSNPFGYRDRARMVTMALIEAGMTRFDVVPFPLEAPGVWESYVPLESLQLVRTFSDWELAKAEALRNRGYEVLQLAGSPDTRISATAIREAMAAGEDGWRSQVPGAVARMICSAGLA